MSALFYIGRAFGIASAERRGAALIAQKQETTDHVIDGQDSFRVAATKPVINRAHETTVDLIENMNARAARLSERIARDQEELRQVETVREGAKAMLDHIARGMPEPSPVSSELSVAPPLD